MHISLSTKTEASSAQRRTPSNGQSMMEGIIALGILLTAVASALTLASSSLMAEKESESTIIAANLAREGIEVARNIRDSNWLAGRPWDDGLEGAASDYTGIPVFDPATASWRVDFGADDVAEGPAAVYRHSTAGGSVIAGLHVQAAAPPASAVQTVFRRLLILDALCSDPNPLGYVVRESGAGCGAAQKIGLRAVSRMRWTSAGRTRNQDVEELLFDWR